MKKRTSTKRTLLALLVVLSQMLVMGPADSGEQAVGWHVECPLSHRRHDDPIVHPTQLGASHLHDFFGNRSTDAFSTHQSLTSSGTTCSLLEDTAAYWIPTLSRGGRKVKPIDFDFYYLGVTEPHEAIHPFPADLRMIAGNPMAPAPQGLQVVQWLCDGGEARTTPPKRCRGKDLVARIKFPDCWDGVSLDSSDHRSHMAYSGDVEGDGLPHNVCPETHPVPVPRLSFRIQWPVHRRAGIRLSGDHHHRTLHADFINAWQQGTLEALVRDCINAGVPCGRLNSPDED